jgi:organic radical activating enzyme
LDVTAALELLNELDRACPQAEALSVTGGEPLEQVGFLLRLLPEVKARILQGRRVLLETAGLHPEAMGLLTGLVDMVSMDVKLKTPSGLDASLPEHRRFLKALSGTECYVKAVVNEETPPEEVEEAAAMVAAERPEAVFFLQPETQRGKVRGGAYLIDLWKTARARIQHVRIQPQIHRILSVR